MLYHNDAVKFRGKRIVVPPSIGLYRDVWIAAIAQPRTSMATLTVVMCNTSQCKLRSLRVNSGMFFLQILIDPIHAAAIMKKKRGLACKFTANLRVSTYIALLLHVPVT